MHGILDFVPKGSVAVHGTVGVPEGGSGPGDSVFYVGLESFGPVKGNNSKQAVSEMVEPS